MENPVQVHPGEPPTTRHPVDWRAFAVAVALGAGTSIGLALIMLPDPPEEAGASPAVASLPPPSRPARPSAPAGKAGPQLAAKAEPQPRPPQPRTPHIAPPIAKHIRVDVSRRRVAIYEHGRLVRVLYRCSFGRSGHETPLLRGATLSISRRERLHRSTRYYGAPMPYALFLREAPNIAFHGGDTGARSHGCIHLARRDAKWLFDWAGRDPVRVDIVATA